jgi:hypothetical protein
MDPRDLPGGALESYRSECRARTSMKQVHECLAKHDKLLQCRVPKEACELPSLALLEKKVERDRFYAQARAAKVKSVASTACKIAPAQAAAKIQEVGNSGCKELPSDVISNRYLVCSADKLREFNKLLSLEEMEASISHIAKNDSKDICGLCSRLFVYLARAEVMTLARCVNMEITLDQWGDSCPELHECKAIPLYKKGDAESADNYRSICIGSVEGKLVERCLAVRSSDLHQDRPRGHRDVFYRRNAPTVVGASRTGVGAGGYGAGVRAQAYDPVEEFIDR